MANWEDVINVRIIMGRVRPLFIAVNALRRRREEGQEERRPGVIPFLGRGIVLADPRSNQQERVPGRNSTINTVRGRSRSYPAPPPNIFGSQPHSQPCCLTLGLCYMAPNAWFPSSFNIPSHHVFNPPCPCLNHYTCHLPPLHPFSRSQIILKVLPQSLLTLRMVTPSKPIAAPLNYYSTYFYLLF